MVWSDAGIAAAGVISVLISLALVRAAVRRNQGSWRLSSLRSPYRLGCFLATLLFIALICGLPVLVFAFLAGRLLIALVCIGWFMSVAGTILLRTKPQRLHDAVERSDVDAAERLLRAGEPVDGRDRLGATPLHWAAMAGDQRLLVLLLAHGADVNAKVQVGGTILMLPGSTALHEAALRGMEGAVETLIENGADIEAADNNGETALHVAAEMGYDKIVHVLLQHGADPQAKDKVSGGLALHRAAWRGHCSVIRLLIEHNVSVNAQTAFGSTPLHSAAENGHKEAARLLLQDGADPTQRDSLGRSPLDIALANGHSDLADVLRSQS